MSDRITRTLARPGDAPHTTRGATRTTAFSRVVAAAAVASMPVAFGTLYLALLAVEFDFAALSDPAMMITRGSDAAGLYFWSMILDMFGYYLLLLPAVLYLWYWLSPRSPGLVSLYTVGGLFYILIGAVGAVILAAVGHPMLSAYTDASGAERELLVFTFQTFTNLVYGGLWSILNMVVVAVWWIGIASLLRTERPMFARASFVLGGAALLNAGGTVLGLELLAQAGLFVYLYLAPVWALWLGIAVARGAGAQEVRAAERNLSSGFHDLTAPVPQGSTANLAARR